MDLHKIVVKFFAAGAPAVPLETYIPVFHRWIQKGSVEGLLLDVADYGHLPQSPGIVLVAHEADYMMDASEGPLGLLYNRKGPGAGSLSDRIKAAFKAALGACVKLEQEPELQGKLKFSAGQALFIANDRLLAPNREESFQELRPDLALALQAVYGGAPLEIARDTRDPRTRLTVSIRSAQPTEAAALLARLA
jgi:hypothetical protein